MLIKIEKLPIIIIGDITTMNNKSKFFEFFKTKRLKLSLVIFFGTIGVVSNYSALKYFLAQTRMDFLGSEVSLTRRMKLKSNSVASRATQLDKGS